MRIACLEVLIQRPKSPRALIWNVNHNDLKTLTPNFKLKEVINGILTQVNFRDLANYDFSSVSMSVLRNGWWSYQQSSAVVREVSRSQSNCFLDTWGEVNSLMGPAPMIRSSLAERIPTIEMAIQIMKTNSPNSSVSNILCLLFSSNNFWICQVNEYYKG